VTFSGALLLLVVALLRGNDEGWGSASIVALLAAAGVLLIAFVAVELRTREPMLPLELFRRGAFTGVQLAAFAVSAGMFATFPYVTLYLQNALALSPLDAGLRYLPITVTIFLVAPLAGAALTRVPARGLLSAGLLLTAVGLWLMAGLETGSRWTALLAGFLVGGVGVGMLNPVIADVAMSVVPKERSGMAAGINDTFRQLGVAVGIAAWGALLVGGGGTPDGLLEPAPPAAGFLDGLNGVLIGGAAVAAAGALVVLWLVREQDIEREPLVAATLPGGGRAHADAEP
jgi:predicted MFS family arabinose efflux permease